MARSSKVPAFLKNPDKEDKAEIARGKTPTAREEAREAMAAKRGSRSAGKKK